MERNIAFIDAQNLHLWTNTENWQIDFKRFRVYLDKKLKVEKAFYFLWFLDENEEKLYTRLQDAGFIVIFREHNSKMKWKKKWNVDVDICFEMMKNYSDNPNFDKIVLVSWDWDYIKPVKYLIEKWKFKKILFPNNKYSSLYKKIKWEYGINLSLNDIRRKIEYKKMR
jgi:uncharacterized LabA/DUF88 family protein